MAEPDHSPALHESTFCRAVAMVAAANVAYFFVEFFVARHIRSVSLFADSIDFLEDAGLNLLILVAVRHSLKARARIGMLLAFILLVPTIATAWTAWQKILAPAAPEPWLLSSTGFGAFLVNFGCAAVLIRYRNHHGSLTRAAFLSARNDVLSNAAIIAAAFVTLRWRSAWPDLAVGLGIAAMNSDAALKVWRAARRESALAEP